MAMTLPGDGAGGAAGVGWLNKSDCLHKAPEAERISGLLRSSWNGVLREQVAVVRDGVLQRRGRDKEVREAHGRQHGSTRTSATQNHIPPLSAAAIVTSEALYGDGGKNGLAFLLVLLLMICVLLLILILIGKDEEHAHHRHRHREDVELSGEETAYMTGEVLTSAGFANQRTVLVHEGVFDGRRVHVSLVCSMF